MVVRTNNPAGRLHNLLTKARAVSSKDHAISVWEKVLEAEPNSEESLALRFLQLVKLYAETKSALKAIEGLNHDLYLGEMHRIQNLLFLSALHRPWDEVKVSLTDTVMQALAFGAEKLAESPLYREIEQEELEALRKEVELFSEMVTNSNLEPQVKVILLRLVSELRNALLEYQIRGPKRLLEAAEAVSGIILFNWPVIDKLDDPRAKEGLYRVWARFRAALSLSADVLQLSPAAVAVVKGLLER